MSAYHPDTICAVATPPGRGGVGILRVSGPKSREIGGKVLRHTPRVRHAHYSAFYIDERIVDRGIALYFAAPNSFTGEDVLEFQGHGGPVILDMLMEEVLKLGARPARPGEFSERAFLNDKLDLTQAEAIADLIDASSRQAARQALNTLEGEFSHRIEAILDQMVHLRMYVESAIDFPEEEIDFLSDGKVSAMLDELIELIKKTRHQAQQGVVMREGMKVVIAGRPNAGKSSLLNRLAEKDLAIVTDIAGTTRDVLREHIHIDGLPLHIIDTAGLRESPDQVEKMGIERAWQEIDQADAILLMIDSTDPQQLAVQAHWPEFFDVPERRKKLTVIYNKIDQSAFKPQQTTGSYSEIVLSALTGEGMEALKTHLKDCIGYEGDSEGSFSARRRHLASLDATLEALLRGRQQLQDDAQGELLAEDLLAAQHHLGEITGKFTPDDLLGKIFSSFCIGK